MYGGPGGRATRRCLCDNGDATIDDDDALIDDDDAMIDDNDASIDDDDATIDNGNVSDDANAHTVRGTGQYVPPGARRHAQDTTPRPQP